jgi:hypothetical protein
MKKILIFTLIIVGCSDDDSPVFRIEDGDVFGGPFLTNQFEEFSRMAEEYNVTVPRNNLILRWIDDETFNTNDSRSFLDGEQIIVEIDEQFIRHVATGAFIEVILFQNLAHALLDRDWEEDCGMMWRVESQADVLDPERDYSDMYKHYPNLFDPSKPCY